MHRVAKTLDTARLVACGAQGISLGCTEVGLLLGASGVAVPLVDACRMRPEAAARQWLPGRRNGNLY